MILFNSILMIICVFSGYDVREIKDTVMSLNNTLHTQSSDLSAVKQKYSNE